MSGGHLKLAKITLCLAGVWLLAANAGAAVPEQMKLLIEQRRAAEAYELGLQHPEMTGEPLYDYYFGIAAVDAGRPGLGVLALERFMLQDPSNDLAHLELGRAYFMINDYVRAEREFKVVLAKSPPASVVRTIQRYMSEIKKRKSKSKVIFGGFVEAGFGYTSNVNSGVSNPDLILPIYGPVRLSNNALAKASEVGQFSGGGFVSMPLGGNFRAGLSTSLAYRNNTRVTGYDLSTVTSSLNIGYFGPKTTLTVGGSGGFALLDEKKFRKNYGGSISAKYKLRKNIAISTELSAQQLKYFGLNSNRDGWLYTGSLTAELATKLPGSPVFSATGYYGKETNERARQDFARTIKGGRAAIIFVPAPKFVAMAGYGLARWEYKGPDPLFQKTRKDWFHSADAAIQYELTTGLSLRLEGQYADDQSNIPLYRFKQKQFAVVLRREWK